jgi:polynucleotide 5'-hydroxyl-kinase GRC3/NOL9
MNKTVDKGKTLLVNGPASVVLMAGKAEVFGFLLKDSRRIIIREGKRLPFWVLESTTFELALGKDAAATETEGDTIPRSWQTAAVVIREIQKKPAVVMVVGGVDSGKSSFCTYLANRLVSDQCRVAILDEDVGQSDIGPPCTVGYAVLSMPVTDLFTLKPENVVFVGVTSPSEATEKTIQAAAALKTEIQTKAQADYLIVNTDGWNAGEDAAKFKGRLAEALKPGLVFYLQPKGELSFLGTFRDAFAAFRTMEVEAPPVVRLRDKAKRKSIRELGFAKYLENSKLKVYPLTYICVEGSRKSSLMQQESENLLVGLLNAQRQFLGIGVIRGFDATRKTVKIQTPVEEKPAILALGRVTLDGYLREIPTAPTSA